ncbi:MAG: 3-isopropylmalate dehydratase small subunit [Nannocystaceae bacterium]
MSTARLPRVSLVGRSIAVPGNDIDTDRIIPARYLKRVSFSGLGEHAFADDRGQLRDAGRLHPFDDPTRSNATILLVNRNFGCGSSREHAPQALMRWNDGLTTIIGESFADIFFGNCVSLGIPCVAVAPADMERLMAVSKSAPDLAITVDLERMQVRAGSVEVAAQMPDGARQQMLTGRWDATGELLAGLPEAQATAARLPYLGWACGGNGSS